MPVARRSFLASAAVAVLAAPALLREARADAAPLRLKLHHSLSSVSTPHDRFVVPWARQIEAQSNGRLRIEIFPAMQLGGAPAQLFDQARDGFADIVWAEPRTTPGRFPKFEVFELPFVPSRRALVSSKAIEDYARSNAMDEFREVHPICFSCADRGVVHSNRPIHTIEDVKGLRLCVQTRFAGEAMRALGAVAVPMPSGQLAIAITQHVVDGSVEPWDMVPALRLNDLLKTHTDFSELSLSSTTFVLAMNNASYNRLPHDLKTIIDENSGQVAAGMAGAMWDLKAAAVADAVSRSGDPITTLLPEAVAHWRQATVPVIEIWLKQMKEQKVDGGKLLADARGVLAKYVDLPEPQPPQPPQPPEQPQPPAETSSAINPPARPDTPATTPTTPVAPVAKGASAPSGGMASSPPVTPPAPAAPPPVQPAPAAGAPPPVAKSAPALPPKPKVLDIPL